MNPSPELVLAETRAWVDRVVIGLNLCPFAKAVQVRNQVRYVVSEATDVNTLLDELRASMSLSSGFALETGQPSTGSDTRYMPKTGPSFT